MPTFDIVSEVDMQEVRNAVDQANREATTRFDFKNTDSAIDLSDNELVLRSSGGWAGSAFEEARLKLQWTKKRGAALDPQ